MYSVMNIIQTNKNLEKTEGLLKDFSESFYKDKNH